MARLKALNICKKFSGVTALDNASLEIESGEVLALLGENGAGKSTISKIISGIYTADSGEIFIDNNQVNISSISDAEKNGISIIHQEIMLISEMKIFENIFLGREIKKRNGFTDDKKMIEQTNKFLEKFNFDISANTKVAKLSIAQQQIIEIIKAVSFNSNIIFMDEPTSSLTDKETQYLFKIINDLKNQNVSIIYISHKLEELFAIGDRITVMRDGSTVGTVKTLETNKNELISMMVGRTLNNYYKRTFIENNKYNSKYNNKEKILEVKNLYGKPYLKNINFSLYKGEILGFAGLVGAGRSELMKIIFGIDKKEKGEIYIDGNLASIDNVSDTIKYGIALLPENRKEEGLVLENNVGYNITLCILNKFINFIKVNNLKENSIIKKYIDKLSIKTSSSKQMVKFLSGGNQQKIVLAKWLATSPKVLILDEPTRGIDVGSKSEIYEIMDKLVLKGVSIILISSELPEVIGMSDRIAVMHNGCITGILNRDDFSQEKIMHLATS
ncbi:sugar ABC transporter ATP-binding protein [uncultured Brachyspira sp.]|uniref:sugar ABC transporter ATP-binding protein n=2 Tax=uncultured Brachyspira sp. TaxID=221953 RepID=UPI0025DE4999|nr:sugar ABC transporter ATP-binding protein [uncultured Brachyspira sp.]